MIKALLLTALLLPVTSFASDTPDLPEFSDEFDISESNAYLLCLEMVMDELGLELDEADYFCARLAQGVEALDRLDHEYDENPAPEDGTAPFERVIGTIANYQNHPEAFVINEETLGLATGIGLAGLTTYTLIRLGARAIPLGGILVGTAAHASSMDEFYMSPEGFRFFLSLSPEQQARELQRQPALIALLINCSLRCR